MNLRLLMLMGCFSRLVWATDQSNPLEAKTALDNQDEQITETGHRIDELQEKLRGEIERYNQLVAERAGQAEKGSVAVAGDEKGVEHHPSTDLTKRVEQLEREVAALKAGKPDLGGARTTAEAEATKKAFSSAPLLKVDTPATAQYAQAQALMKNGELEKAKESFLQILSSYPEDSYVPRVHLHLGEIHLHLKNYSEAAKYFSLALEGKLEDVLIVEARLGSAEADFHLGKTDSCCQQAALVQKSPLGEDQTKRLQEIVKQAKCTSPSEKKSK